MKWYLNSVFYQIYPLGFCGAPLSNDGQLAHRILRVRDWIPHLRELGVTAVYFGPVFESSNHGYDTMDFARIDCRLGSNQDFADLCADLHEAGIQVVVDGVFHHVGRDFWAFRDVLEKRQASPYANWFHINFDGNSNYNDGLWYEGWEGHYELVKLNLHNPEVTDHIFSCIHGWAEEFGIDGLRLDVAYLLDQAFIRRLRETVADLKEDFFLLGEMIHGDYNRLLGEGMLDSCTNYECYKGLHSSFNNANLFEIAYSLNRQFGPEQWTLYKGKHLMNFADNHDVNRLASTLKEPAHLPLLYGLLFTMPGIPCVYYGSEWGIEGVKQGWDDSGMRPCLDRPEQNDLTLHIARLARIHREEKALSLGDYRQVFLTNQQLVFERAFGEERILVAINMDSSDFSAQQDVLCFSATDLLTGEPVAPEGVLEMPGCSIQCLKIRKV